MPTILGWFSALLRGRRIGCNEGGTRLQRARRAGATPALQNVGSLDEASPGCPRWALERYQGDLATDLYRVCATRRHHRDLWAGRWTPCFESDPHGQ